ATGEVQMMLSDRFVWGVAYSPDGGRVVIGGAGGGGPGFDPPQGPGPWPAPRGGGPGGVRPPRRPGARAPARRGGISACGARARRVMIWDAMSGQEVLTLRGHTAMVASLAFSPDGRRLATGGTHHVVRVWDATPVEEPSRSVVRTLGHTSLLFKLAFSPDGKR